MTGLVCDQLFFFKRLPDSTNLHQSSDPLVCIVHSSCIGLHPHRPIGPMLRVASAHSLFGNKFSMSSAPHFLFGANNAQMSLLDGCRRRAEHTHGRSHSARVAQISGFQHQRPCIWAIYEFVAEDASQGFPCAHHAAVAISLHQNLQKKTELNSGACAQQLI